MNNRIEYRGYTIRIEQDTDPLDPREWDNLGTMVCWHRRYNLGDEHDFDTPDDAWQEIKKNHIVLPLYLYEHSGITMNTTGFGCPWDSGRVGYIYVSHERVRKEYGWKHITKRRREKILEHLRDEVQTYDDYITGSVYGYVIEGNNEDTEDGDSSWGFYGYPTGYNEALEDAKGSIDWMCKEAQEQYEKEPKKKAAELYTI